MSVFNQKASAPMSTDTPPSGSHPAVLVALIDFGTHLEEYQGKAKKTHKVYLLWEMVESPVSGQPSRNHVVGNRYTLSFAPSAKLREMIETWRGRKLADGESFDLKTILGRKCFVTVGHQAKGDRTYANLQNVGPVPVLKGKPLDVPEPKYTPFAWEIGQGDIPAYPWLPFCYGQSIAEIIKDSNEYRKLTGKPAADAPLADGEVAEEEEEAVTAPDGGPLENAPW